MEPADKVVIVTGGASGIGRALCLAFVRAGARAVVVADLDGAGAAAVAEEIGALGGSVLAVRCDVGVEPEVQELVRTAENRFGPVDVFCANAGVLVTGGIEAPDEQWDLAWRVNVKSHLYAARAVVPGMLERGGGQLVHTASAAGLLMQLGAAPYSVTKHAIVAFAEWLSVTYHDRGLRVAALCPQGVATNLLSTSEAVLAGREPSSSPGDASLLEVAAEAPEQGGGAFADGIVSPERCAELTLEAMREERFLVLPHPEVATYEQHRAGDRERWLRGMRRAQAQMDGFLSGDA